MIVERITSPDQILRHWDIFREGLKVIRAKAGESMTEESYAKLLTNLAERTEDVWIGVVFQGGPLGYGVAADSTPPASTRRTFTVSSFYHVPGQTDATIALMNAFEAWARAQNVKSYIVTTRRTSGAAIACFTSGRYGFRQSFRAFEKTL